MPVLFEMPTAPLAAALVMLGIVACLALLAFALVAALRIARRLSHDEFAGLYGTYYGYRAPLNPDPLLPLPLGVELEIVPSPWRSHPHVVWQNPALATHNHVTGRAYRNAEGFTVILDEGANLPFVIVLLDLTRHGVPDIKVGIQCGMLQALKHPYAASVLFSRRPLDQLVAAEALKRFGAFGMTIEGARQVAQIATGRGAQARPAGMARD